MIQCCNHPVLRIGSIPGRLCPLYRLEAKLAAIDGGVQPGRRMSFLHREAYQAFVPHLLMMTDGQWRGFGVQTVQPFRNDMIVPDWRYFEVDEIVGEITVVAGDEASPRSSVPLGA